MPTDPIRDTMCERSEHSEHHLSADQIDVDIARKSAGSVTTSLPGSPRLRVALALAVIGAFATAVAFVARTAADHRASLDAAEDDEPRIVSIEQGHLRFEYHTRTGSSYLWDLRTPERDRLNRIRDLPDDALRMRLDLERKLRIRSLDTLHEPHRAAADRLRELGYL